ncbi:MAG TPA: APC family permease, partial [Methylomirabilota bacterium]|nr:APC family permease [Methylomirabilota bacterium]
MVTPLRHLGRLRLLAVGVNSVIGGGIFIMPAVVAARVGPASLPAYVVAGLFVGGVGMALARLAARHDRSGGPYVYIHDAFGPFAGFQAGWLFTLARLTAAASLFNGFARYVAALLPGGGGTVARVLLVLACAAFVTGVNIAGIRQTAGVANAFAVLKVVPLLVLAVAGLFAADLARLVPTACDPMEFVRAVLLLVFAFTGFEIATLPAEESHRPRRDMPAALALTLVIVCAVYLAVQAMAMGLVPDLGREQAPLATAAALVAGQEGRYAITAVAALSTAGCSLASLVGGSRMMYAMASGRQIPAWIGALSPRFRTPLAASLLLGGIGALLAMLAAYEWLSAVSAGARLLVYLGC